ncbi:MotA/TolQ/ExbB proton channel family protein [Verrucomicrobium sp. GAS474]|uniref:MotA/TolQ/ExbB proton channel family protein n=1 Tax=Verrucomicrobium sp. GAS474 TaxID=1882831 RepID=UPI000B812DC0|nr:MotA/TolQ/ExbB proton channel family protein [Verrucomicrobium sp. GAS474]
MGSSLMVNFFAAGGLLFAFEHSTPAGRFVIGTLLIASLVSWSVIASKWSEIRLAKKQTARFLAKFRASRKPLQVFLSRETFHGSPIYEVYRAGCRELCYHLTGSAEIDEMTVQRLASAPPLSPTAFSAVESALGREVGVRGLQLDARMIFLATAVSGGPFLGLLGTVWGVMDTFSDIAEAGKASLAAMAPGVSGALITTVTGLLVAIPAMFGYNYLVSTIRSLTVEMDNFAAELAASFGHRYAAGESFAARADRE